MLSEADANQFSSHLLAPTVDGRIFLISARHILKNENATLYEKCLEPLADHFNMPPIPLAAFEPPMSYFKPYSELTLRLRGAVPFAKIGNITLIAILNPTDAALKAALEAVGPCRFYLADPTAVEATLERVYGTSPGGGS